MVLLFDTVQHDILISKLRKYGLASITVKRIHNVDQKIPTLISVKYWALPGTSLFMEGTVKQRNRPARMIKSLERKVKEKSRRFTT